MNKSSAGRITVKQIAEAAGCSPATVSLALRGDPRIAESTRATVQAVAQRLGYKPDPRLSHLMGYLKQVRARGEGSVMAVLGDWPEPQLRSHAYMGPLMQGIEERCAQLGYHPDLFVVGPRMRLKRIEAILQARGIQGLVILPFQSGVFALNDFDFSRFSAATIGYGLQSPQIHRAASQQTLAAMRVVEKVMDAGYQRIGLVMTRDADARTQHRYLAGYLGRVFSEPRLLPFIEPFIFELSDSDRFAQWIKANRIDAVVSTFHQMYEQLVQIDYQPGVDIGLAMINYRGSAPVARMETPYPELGRSSVNLVHSMLCLYETGIPAMPSVLTVPGVWVDGASLPVRERC